MFSSFGSWMQTKTSSRLVFLLYSSQKFLQLFFTFRLVQYQPHKCTAVFKWQHFCHHLSGCIEIIFFFNCFFAERVKIFSIYFRFVFKYLLQNEIWGEDHNDEEIQKMMIMFDSKNQGKLEFIDFMRMTGAGYNGPHIVVKNRLK